MFQPLTREQYESALKFGFTPEQIIANEKIRKLKTETKTETKKSEGDWLDKASAFAKKWIPGAVLGEAVGTSLAAGAELLKGNKQGYKDILATQKTPLEVGGSALSAVLTPATLAVTPAASVLGKAAQFGGLSAASGFASSLESGNSLKQAAVDAFQSGLTGVALGGTVGLAGKGITNLVNKAPEALTNNALKITQKIKIAGKSPSKFLLDKGVWGNLGTYYKAAQNGMDETEKIISSKVSKMAGGITYGEIKKIAINNLQSSLGKELFNTKQISQMIDSVPVESLKTKGIINWTQLNNVRGQLGNLIGDSKWAMGNPSEKVKAAQAVYRAMASTLQKYTNTTAEFAEKTKWVQTMSAVKRAINLADSKFGLGLYDILGGITGATIGGFQGQSTGERITNAIKYGTGAIVAERVAQSPALKTAVANLINKVGKLSTDSVGRISKTAVIKLIGELFK